ncbi:MAG: glucoamylase family protein, partial [Bacilli bacterium]|nr:glucoamylase family protein [Bacilli bacterium]
MKTLLFSFRKDIHGITDYYKKLIAITKNNKRIGHINEWIVDNYYVISEQEKYTNNEYRNKRIKRTKRRRKKLLYALVYNILKSNDFQINMPKLFEKLNVYQKETGDYFSYHEINIIYIFIRMILISELNMLCKRLDDRLIEKYEVERIFKLISKDLDIKGSINLDDYININDRIIKHPYYIEQLNYKLKGLGKLSEDAFVILNKLLQRNKISLRELIEQSHNEMASDNFLIINLFSSLKKVSRYKMEYLYKNLSYTEKVLIGEKANIYHQIYDNNKGEYRNQIIKEALKRGISEYEYAVEVVGKADENHKHVGWYLFKDKNYILRARLYIITILVLTLFISFIIAWYAGFASLLILLIPISGLVIETINQALMHVGSVKSLFKLKFEDGLPQEYSTMVVIPTIVNNKQKVLKMFDALETYYLSNKTDNIYFTLLGDCTSEMVQYVEKDKEIVEAGLNKVNQLNEKYGKNIFFYAYRNRFYSESEECFLGFERKRGALLHFNKLLLNRLTKKEKDQYFNCHTFNDFDIPIKYVITLDTDTKLVLNTALVLIGAMAHPMNSPVLSEDKRKVISGYGVMQPRIGIDVEVTSKSLYSQLFAGLGGLDIYTTASFDLYQDVFNEGSFVGKGIYDLEVFDRVLSNTFPNDLILSHDLIEGSYLRCGLVNDVELFDDYPSAYLNDAIRHHRWNRGDWQISGWLKNKVTDTSGEVVSNPISILSKWKIFDNLRRSLTSLFLLLIIFYGFTIGIGEAFYYLLLVGIIIALPIIFYLFSKVIYRSKYDMFLKYYLNLVKGIFTVINKSYITLTVLPYEAYLYLDSIIKSLYRMFVSKKKLLNWITAEEIEKTLKNNLETYLKTFKINYICSVLLVVGCAIYKPNDIVIAAIIASVWFLAPIVMYFMSQKLVLDQKSLDKHETKDIINLATRTWQYFDDLIAEEYNYLIPDNYQLNREEKVDHKTSPTNIGFSLLSVISAYELGIISNDRAVKMITNIITSIERLEKWNGHLFNWYDIYSLEKMHPYFISTVDNGNLAASLYVVKGFLEKQDNREMLYRVSNLIEEMDFTKLYSNDLDVFSIGYDYGEQTLVPYNYNNFASEARLTSYIAIAKGDAPYKHWFCLDKALTKYKYYKGVASWSGTAFEYFMPLIFNKTFDHTLLDETYYYAYYTQREFIREINPKLPWGISESAYNELDDSENYKYESFGIPYLKLQDSPSYPIVISPYSSIMAISIDDQEVYNNINKFKDLNMYGKYGFYEAYDYEDNVIIKNYYAHHQGMILTSLTNYLKDNIIQEYFHSDKNIASVEMLLKEKVQIKTYIDLKISKYKKHLYSKETHPSDIREYNELKSVPEFGVLSNGFYSLIINDRGVGLSKYKNLQVNRYRKIASEDYGIFLYIRNLNSNKLWSNTYAPLNAKPNSYKVAFASDRIKYVREDDGIVTTTEMTVVKDHNAELRKITFQNDTDRDVTLEITSFAEVIMCRNEEDIAHRAFNSLSINSEIDKDTSSLIFSRKSRTKDNTKYFVVNRMFLSHDNKEHFEYETSRAQFIGRNRDVTNPKIIMEKQKLSKTIGASLDPIMSIRKRITIKAKGKSRLYLLVGFGKSKEQVMEIVGSYSDDFSVDKAFDMSTVLNNIRTSYNNLTPHQMHLYNAMLKYIFYALPMTDKRKKILEENQLSQQALWKFKVSGDWPIILVNIDKIEDVGFIKDVLQVYEFYKVRAIYIDIVIINNEKKTKAEIISNYLNNIIYHINSLNYFENTPGSVYEIPASQINQEELSLLNTVAMVSLDASNKQSLGEQIYSLMDSIPEPNKLVITNNLYSLDLQLPKDIEFYNSYGGFVNQGREYLINKLDTPTPWVNVIANDSFGFIQSNNMGGFTYAHNSREFKLTSWSNDMVGNYASEVIMINNHKFKPSLTKHGFGYTIFYSITSDYDISLKVFIGLNDKIKFYELNVTNKLDGLQTIRFSILLEMVLGVTNELTHRYLTSYFDKDKNCLYIKNNYNSHFKKTSVFLTSTEPITSFNDDDNVMKSITVDIEFKANESKTFSFMLGCEQDDDILTKYRNEAIIKQEYAT